MPRWTQWLHEQAARRENAGLSRTLHPRGPDDGVLDLAGNDYLGLATDERVREAAADAVHRWGAGAGASRLVTGTLEVHEELEREFADFLDQPAALVMSTGYHANLAAVTALADRETVLVSDAHVHASLVDAARLSRAEVVIAPHSDVAAVEQVLSGAGDRRAMVLVESVYSVLGDAAPLRELAQVCRAHDALLLVDEAHGIGVVGAGGRGLVAELGLAGQPHVLVTATLSKSLAAQGGSVLGSRELRTHLINRARPFIFDTGLAPAAAAGALAALRALRSAPALPDRTHRRTRQLADLLGVEAPAGAVLSVPMSSPGVALAAQAECLRHGVRVGCFRPPSVPDGVSRLRITCNAGLLDADWDAAVAVVRDAVEASR